MTQGESGKWLKSALIDRGQLGDETRQRISQLKGDPDEIFTDAVAIATTRLAAVKPVNSNIPGFEFYTAVVYYKRYLPNGMAEEDISDLIVKAETDWFAYQVLLLVIHLTPTEMQLDNLRAWNTNQFLGINKIPNKPRGKSSAANIHRDVLVVKLIGQLEEIGLSPMRGRISAQCSGCDVIQKALENLDMAIDYKSVEKIWERRNELRNVGLTKDLAFDYMMKILS